MAGFHMVEVKNENGFVHVTFSTEGMSPQQVEQFVQWLQKEAPARRAKILDDAGWEVSEEIKTLWWEKNQNRFGE